MTICLTLIINQVKINLTEIRTSQMALWVAWLVIANSDHLSNVIQAAILHSIVGKNLHTDIFSLVVQSKDVKYR